MTKAGQGDWQKADNAISKGTAQISNKFCSFLYFPWGSVIVWTEQFTNIW